MIKDKPDGLKSLSVGGQVIKRHKIESKNPDKESSKKPVIKTGNIKGKKEFKNLVETVKYVAKIADEKKADYIKIIEVGPRLVITDYFILISVSNTRSSSRIADEIGQSLKKYGLYPLNINGKSEGNWILMDYDEFIVHIFTHEYMQYYDLERLWRDSKVLIRRPAKKDVKSKDEKTGDKE